jgi:hypothetical protein
MVFNFFFLDADANADRAVDTTDFNQLAASFSQSGKTFSQGDFNYDTNVDTLDFNALAARFGKTLPAPSVRAAETLLPGAPSGSPMFGDRRIDQDNLARQLLGG